MPQSAQAQENIIHMIKHHQMEDILTQSFRVVIQGISLNKIGPVLFQNLKHQDQDIIDSHQNSATMKAQNSETKSKRIRKIKLFKVEFDLTSKKY